MIARGVGIDRKTARRYIAAAVELGVDREGGERQLTDELIGQVLYLMVLDRLRIRTDTKGWRLAVTSTGHGAAVVFVHGLGGSGRYWDRLIGRCQQQDMAIRAIRVDLLGFGASPKPTGATYNPALHVASLLPYVPAGSVVVGHSAGAIVAGALAAGHPERVASLLLLGAPAFPDEETARREISRLGLLARLTVQHPWAGSGLCAIMCALRPALLPLAPRLATDIPGEIATDFLHHTWTSYSRTLRRVVIEHRLAPDLVAARRPVRFMAGKEDSAAPLSHTSQLVDNLNASGINAELMKVAGGHHLALHDPATVAAALNEILTNNAARSN